VTAAVLQCGGLRATEPSLDISPVPEERFAAALSDLADRCDELGLAEQARQTRDWSIPRDPNRQYLFIPSEHDPLKPTADAPQVAHQWYRKLTELRLAHAAELFTQAQEHIAAGQSTMAYQRLHEVLREDSEHAEAQRILGGRRYGREVGIRTRNGRTEHPKYGWPRGSYWRVETPHFRITTNHSVNAATRVGYELEELYSVWQQLFFDYWSSATALAERFDGRTAILGRPHRHEVVLFRDRQSYVETLSRIEPQITISTGYYLRGRQTAYFYGDEPELRPTRFHEVTHQLLQESGPALDDVGERWNFWLVEGIAVYLESMTAHATHATIGGFDADRLQFARARRLSGDFHMPLDEMCGLGREQLQQHEQISKVYTQAAGLTHFLMDYQGGTHRRTLSRFIRLLYQNRDRPGTLEQLAGSAYAELDEQYVNFLQVDDQDLRFLAPSSKVTNLALGATQVSDAGIARLRSCDRLRWLDLAYTRVTDKGISHLAKKPHLKQLTLEGTRITDAALDTISGWSTLEELDLSGTPITDHGVAKLVRLAKLKTLFLTGTNITDDALTTLKQLDSLEFVDASDTAVSDEALRAFQHAH
jgi:hypothetical protein